MPIKYVENSLSFVDRFGNTTTTYSANAGDIVKTSFNIEENIYFITNNLNVITCNSVLQTAKKLRFPNIESINGFEVGQAVILTKTTSGGATTTVTTTIVSINRTSLEVEFGALLSPAQANLFLYDNATTMAVYSTDTRKDFFLNLGNLSTTSQTTQLGVNGTSNGQISTFVSSSRKSKNDSELSRFYGANGGSITIGSTLNLTQQGNKSGDFEIGIASIKRNANVNAYTRSFTITFERPQITAILKPLFDVGNITFVSPYFDIEFYSGTENNYPSISYWLLRFPQSNTAWLNKAYQNYPIDAVLTSSTQNGLTYNSAVQNTVVITSASSVISMGSIYVPQDEAYYKNQVENLSQLGMLIEQAGALAVGVYTSKINPSGAFYEIEIISHVYALGVHTVVYEFRYGNQAFIDFMDSRDSTDRTIGIWLKVGNTSLSVLAQDLVKADKPVFDLEPYFDSPSKFLTDKTSVTYPSDLIIDGVICSIEDNVSFEVEALLDNSFIYENVSFEVIVAEIADLDNYFVLESAFFDISQIPKISPLNDNLTIFTLSQPKADNMPSTATRFLNAIVTRKISGSADTGTHFGLGLRYPFLINWKYWLEQLNAFTVFDELRTQNWINYDDGTYQIFLKATIQCEDRFLVHHAPIKKIYDYDETHTVGDEEWNGTTSIKYFDLAGDEFPCLINGQVMRVELTVNNIYTATLSTAWAELTIEKKEASPRWNCSTNYNHDNNLNSPFLPLTGSLKLKATLVSGTQQTFEMLVDTNKLNSVDYKLTLKYYNNSTKKEQVRSDWDVKVLDSSLFGQDELFESENECEKIFNVFAQSIVTDDFKNDINSAWKLLLGGDSIVFELYNSNDEIVETLTNITFPSQTNARYCNVIWNEILTENGADTYTLKLKYTFNAVVIYSTWAIYNLQEWDIDKVAGFVKLTAKFNANQLIEGIDFTNANVQDDLNVQGLFGLRNPKLEISNNTYSSRLTTPTKREYLNEYTLITNPVLNNTSRKLLDLFFISEQDIYITDYNSFNHESYIEKRLIVSDTPTIEYPEHTPYAIITGKFGDKVKNQKTSH